MRRKEIKLYYIGNGACSECNYYRQLFVWHVGPFKKKLSQDEVCMHCFVADFESRGFEPFRSTDVEIFSDRGHYPQLNRDDKDEDDNE